ncbi:MAG: hypothetical protein ACJA1A_002736 [Saprospiraceae bacterium]|jgi:hypothetical protein
MEILTWIVANDFGKWLQPNQLFQNEGADIPYVDVSASSNTNAQMYAMGIAVGDYDEDLDLDFYVTNIGENHFFENMGEMNFQDKAAELNIQNTETENGLLTTGWGALLEDFNNDTYLDLLVSNGYVYSVVDIDDTEQNDEFYLGSPEHTFDNATSECGIDFLGPSRGALKGDWNNDGRLDLITITNEKLFPNILNSVNYYQNIGDQNNWVGFKLSGTISNKDAFGARVHLHSGNRTFLKDVRGGDSHASQSSSNLHFGLGDIQEIDSIIIYWPSGLQETLEDLNINKYHIIQEGLSTIINENGQILTEPNIYPNPSNTFFYIETTNKIHSPSLLRIFDSQGALMLEDKRCQTVEKIETKNFAAGLYRLVIYSDSKTISKNILIVNP